jgi:acetoacetyl-CoA synthetase
VDVIAAGPNGEALIGEEGNQVFRRPYPNMPYYFVDDPDRKRYKEAYFSDYTNPAMFNMNDSVIVNPETRGWTVIGRADGVLNPSGVRFGSSEIYFVLETKFTATIEDSIAVGQRTPDGNERVVLFVKTREDVPLSAELVREIKAAIAAALSRRHVPEVIAQCTQVPITGSGKKVEPSIKKILNGVPLSEINLAGVVNPQAYPFFAEWTKANPPRKSKL